jgi:hypothetical protein
LKGSLEASTWNSTNDDWTRAVEEEQYCSVREVTGRGCLKDIATGTACRLGVSIGKRGALIKEI